LKVIDNRDLESKSLAELQRQDDDISQEMRWIEKEIQPKPTDIDACSAYVKALYIQRNSLVIWNDVFYRKWTDQETKEITYQAIVSSC